MNKEPPYVLNRLHITVNGFLGELRVEEWKDFNMKPLRHNGTKASQSIYVQIHH